MTLKGDAKFKGKLTRKNWLIFMQAVESPKFCTLMGSFCPKHKKCKMKKHRRAISHNSEE